MFVGVEIGGTKLQIGLGHGDGTIVKLWRGPVDVVAGGEGIRRQITAAVPELLAQAGVARSNVRGFGLGFGGPVNDDTQTIIRSHQIDGWEDFPIARWLHDVFGLPTALGNDADVAGLAEASFGAGQGSSPIFYITIGSGIGGGLIIDRRIYRGCGQGAAEIGHLRMVEKTGAESILELIASGWAIEQCAAESRLPGWKVPQIVAEAERGNGLAQLVFTRALSALADAICHVIALLCPKRIVIGGGVSLLGDPLFVPLRKLVAERVFRPFAGLTEILPAALGAEVVVHGALALARQRFGVEAPG
jgi:glucokinase